MPPAAITTARSITSAISRVTIPARNCSQGSGSHGGQSYSGGRGGFGGQQGGYDGGSDGGS